MHLRGVSAEVWAIERDRDLCGVLRAELGGVDGDSLFEAGLSWLRAEVARGVAVVGAAYQIWAALFALLDRRGLVWGWWWRGSRTGSASPAAAAAPFSLGRTRRMERVCHVGRGASAAAESSPPWSRCIRCRHPGGEVGGIPWAFAPSCARRWPASKDAAQQPECPRRQVTGARGGCGGGVELRAPPSGSSPRPSRRCSGRGSRRRCLSSPGRDGSALHGGAGPEGSRGACVAEPLPSAQVAWARRERVRAMVGAGPGSVRRRGNIYCGSCDGHARAAEAC